MISGRNRRRPAYFRMLWGILVAYALIIVFGDTKIGDPARVLLLGYLLWTSARLHADRRWRKWALVVVLAAFIATGTVALVDSPRVESGVIGGSSVALIAMSIAAIVSTLRLKFRVDIETVLGVLCVYLLFALLFASVNQVLAAIQRNYLHGGGVNPNPGAGDLLYFSVITLATVGYGDITPATEVARAVAVVEALTGQLYLVSVVAGVIAGWRAAGVVDEDQAEANRARDNQAEADQAAGDQARGNQAGGNQAGGNQAAGDQAGGNQAEGSQAAGDQAGGNQAGDNRAGGNQAAGDQAGDGRAGDGQDG
jgi:hypothetical protein